MLADTDSLSLAPGVVVRGGELTDAVRQASWPLNASGAFVLARVDAPVGQIVREIAQASAIPLEAARTDVLRFAWQLNTLALVNIERRGSRLRRLTDWLALAVRLAPAGAVPVPLTRRRALDTGSVWRAVTTSFAAIRARVAALAALAAAVAGQLSVLAGAPGIAVPLAIGLGTGIGLGLHEAAHAVALRGVPSALVLRGRRTYVLHAAVERSRRSAVALAGPLVAAAAGVAVVACGTELAAPALVVGGCPLAAHAFALTVIGGDGRVACGI